MNGRAEGDQVNAAEQQADTYKHSQHPNQVPGIQRHDQQPQNERDHSIGYGPARSRTIAVSQAVEKGHQTLHKKHDSYD